MVIFAQALRNPQEFLVGCLKRLYALKGMEYPAGYRIITPDELAAAKKAIDREIEAKEESQAVTLSLPVVILLVSYRKKKIVHGVITGLDRDSREVIGIDPPNEFRRSMVLPESKENTKRLERYIQAEAAWKVAESAVEGRSVSATFRGYRRAQGQPFGESVAKLQESYARAQKGDSDD